MKIKTRNAVAAFGGSLAMLSAIRRASCDIYNTHRSRVIDPSVAAVRPPR